MQTRCPACQTLYRIDEDVLQRAAGQARCFRCDQVFNAYEHTVDDAAPGQGDTLTSVDDDGIAHGDSNNEDADTSSSILSELADLPNVPDHSGVDPHSDLNLDDLADSLRDLDSQSSDDIDLFPDKPQHATTDSPNDTRFEASDSLNLDPLDVPSELSPDALQDTPPPSTDARMPSAAHHGPSGAAITISIALLLLAAIQLGWFNREQVIATPQGLALAEGICNVVGCKLPARRAASRFAVLHRDIGADPTDAGVLRMQLRFRNQADFAQPLPDIQLSLYDSEEKLMASRRLHPDEYLFPAPSSGTLVGPGEDIAITLQLEDPGRHTTGFKLEFL